MGTKDRYMIFLIGVAKVSIRYLDNDTYEGWIKVPGPNKVAWKFTDLKCAPVGFGAGVAYDSHRALEKMAYSAVSFGSYYSTHNRGEDTPDWAPSADVADAICAATWESEA